MSGSTTTLPPRLEAALEQLTPRIEAAREELSPRIEAALEQVAPRLDAAHARLRDELAPKIAAGAAAGLTAAAAASAPSRREARRRGEAALAALRGDLPRRRRWPRVVALVGIGVAAGAAAGLVMHRKQPDYPGVEPYPSGPG